ncbi:MAG: TonB-dependent receptor [Gammaproteobacteria bacterium]|nr:TonB-dependent receptor [Gammaproteobacteria bacterium]
MKTLSKLIGLVLSLSFVPFASASAQEGLSSIEEITVTARKRDESLQEVPIAITAFTESTIERAGVERPADFISMMPNVTIVDTANVGDTQVSIRGIVSTRDAESTFAYVVDGVLSTNPNSFNEELVDVQQIEVLKGPQGALYGRNAVSGAVLVTTREPGDEYEGSLQIGYSDPVSAKAAFRFAGGLTDNLRASISGSYRSSDGQYRNLIDGKRGTVDYHDDLTARVRAIWEPSDNLRIDTRLGFSEVEGGAINFNAGFAIPTFAAVFGAPNFDQDVNEVPFRYAFNVPGENEQQTMDFALKADWAMGEIDMTAVLSYSDLEEYLLSDGTSATFYGYELTPTCQNDRVTLNNFPAGLGGADRTDLFGEFFNPFGVFPPGIDFQGVYGPYTPTSCDGYQYQERNQSDVGFELRLTSPQGQALRWIAGIYAAEIDREVVVAYGADQGLGFLRQPYIDPTGPNPTDLLFWDDFETSVIAAFGEIAYDISDAFEVSLALRWDQEDRKVKNKVPNVSASGLNINTLDPVTFQPGPINPGFVANPGGIPDRSRKFDQLQPKLTARWAASDNVNAYASYGIGFRSGGFNSLGSSDLLNFWFNAGNGGPGEAVDAQLVINDEYDKEVSTSVEVGVKTEWMGSRLRVNAAVFNTEVEDNQFFEFFAGPFGILRVVTTIDELSIQGFEADFNFQATDEFSFFGGIGLLDSEIEENVNRPLSVGNPVPQAPEETYNLGMQFDVPVNNDVGMFVRVDYQYVGEMWFHTLQGEQTPNIWQAFFFPGITTDFSKSQRDAYDTVNLRLGFEAESWSVTAWGRNITDEQYLEEVIPAPEFGGSFLHQARGAWYGIDLKYRF